ncbi:hypothetical protein Godav_015303 [Gossypium davidsonii]|uniref:RNase H type-1 domain-containing protein n=1 Tax=Gossypium davidsonii TaxID=34287 RepID=A0A7J8RMP8_GOSDV|nr:hypothetical protein [Gossypium davidsonii]
MSLELVSFIRSYMGGLSVLAIPREILGFLRIARWHPLTTLLVKANFDAAYRGRSHQSCSGVVVSLAFTVEALAVLLVLEFTWDLGLSRVVFEGDSLHVIRKLNSTQVGGSEIWALIKEGRVEEVLVQVESTMAADEGSNAHLP